MATPRLSKLELRIMETLWTKGDCSVREIREVLPQQEPPRLYDHSNHGHSHGSESRAPRQNRHLSHLRRSRLRSAAQRRLIDDLFGSPRRPHPVVAHLVKCSKLTPEDVREAEKALQELKRQGGVMITCIYPPYGTPSPRKMCPVLKSSSLRRRLSRSPRVGGAWQPGLARVTGSG